MHQRKGKKVLIYFFLLVAVGSINNIELNNFKFSQIKTINISGLDERNNLFILKRIKNLNMDNIFFINIKEIKNVFEENTIIENYKIFKIYPSTLDIKINKTKSLAKINQNGKIFYIGSNGKLSEIVSHEQELPFIFGKPKIQEFLEFKKIIDNFNFSYEEVKNFYYFPSKRWDVELKNNIVLKLPKNNSKNSLDYLFEFIADKNLRNNLIIDVRVKNQIIFHD